MKNKPLIKGLKFGFLSMLLFFLFSDFMFKNVESMTWEKASLSALAFSPFAGFIMFLVVWRTNSVFTQLEIDLTEKLSNTKIHQQLKILELKKKDEECEGKSK